MNAVPVNHMEPEHSGPDQQSALPPEDQEAERESDDNFGQWVSLVVLLACWLAEAYL